jgi:acyl-CoA thioester hydrolase
VVTVQDRASAVLVPTYQGSVYPWHCDQMGHMNVMWYVGKFDEATWNLFARMGMTTQYMKDSNTGMAAVDQRIQYRKELVAGATVSIGSGVLEFRDKAVLFFHEMRNNQTGEVSATCRIMAVHMDAVARRAKPFPADFKARSTDLVRAYDFGDRT